MNTVNSLDSRLRGRENNFDFIRFVAAAMVIYSHSFPIAYGDNNKEPLYLFTSAQLTFGHLAVIIFFITSGFLITRSFDRSKNPVEFIKARILRIFPALIILILVTTFIMGPIMSTLSFEEYFTHNKTYGYLLSISLFPMQYELPNVFSNNPYNLVVNGSLWTLSIEFLFYIIVLLFGCMNLLTKRFILLVFIISLFLPYIGISVGENYLDLFRYFVVGMLFYIFRQVIPLNKFVAIFSGVIIFISIYQGLTRDAFAFMGAYLLFYIVFSRNIKYYNFARFGDFSYGLYIMGFPIQQLVVQLLEITSPNLIFLVSFPITLLLSYLSWHFVENPALKLKSKKSNLEFKILKKYYSAS